MKTQYQTNEQALADRKWVLVDAEDQVVGRLASQIASILRGKNKPCYAPHNDDGDFVIVVNVEKIKFTGTKMDDKRYYWHTGYVGGLKEETPRERIQRAPELILQKAVKGMLPKNSLGRQQLGKLKVYVGSSHPHAAQCPVAFENRA